MEWEKTDTTADEAPGKARAGEPGAARMDEAPAAQSGTDGQDLESEAAQPDVGGARGTGKIFKDVAARSAAGGKRTGERAYTDGMGKDRCNN